MPRSSYRPSPFPLTWASIFGFGTVPSSDPEASSQTSVKGLDRNLLCDISSGTCCDSPFPPPPPRLGLPGEAGRSVYSSEWFEMGMGGGRGGGNIHCCFALQPCVPRQGNARDAGSAFLETACD